MWCQACCGYSLNVRWSYCTLYHSCNIKVWSLWVLHHHPNLGPESQHMVHCGYLPSLSTLHRLSDKGFESPGLNQICLLLKASIYSITFTWLGLAIQSQHSFPVFCAHITPFHVPGFQSACSGHFPVLLTPYPCPTTWRNPLKLTFCPSTPDMIESFPG